MKVKVAAKINLMLDILKRLENGYHSLFMIMQSVDLYDTVTVEKNNENKIIIKCDTEGVPCNEKNIAYKCAKAFFDACNIKEQGITIEIEKNIPMAAGTAGGSADGAGVLYCLNKIFNTNLSTIQLAEIGAKVGADIPFSLTGGTAIALNTGNVIASVKDLPECYIVLCKPDQDVSTPEAYAQFDALSRVRHLDRVSMIEAVASGDYENICTYCGNVFEQAVEVPKRPHIKGVMRKCGADACCMSGSGPTVFGLFSDKEKAEDCYNKLSKKYDSVYLCKPANKGVIEI
ncbi:MAG: 4-(cytidine 5'-diphospho)-2-C-methyl-D-erythritol kinase [Ruminococcaceae bacterium]|nr:4-(cytidine 5'-diphospho)-2-C-methyl-D-erythritol kinase [Oscillospiraceae bacterium]